MAAVTTSNIPLVSETPEKLSPPPMPFKTAGLRPELFDSPFVLSLPRVALVIALAILIIGAFGFRVVELGNDGLSDDELNKLSAVSDYRAHGLTAANGEHPFFMKAMQTISVVAAQKWNAISLVSTRPNLSVSVEAALRFPNVLFAAFAVILIYLVASELFGVEVGFIAAALWAFDPLAIGFNRIGKEDTLFVFFFLLANVFWLRGQRVAEGQPERDPQIFYWLTSAAFALMVASKYYPQMLAASVAYNYAFQRIPVTRWVIGKRRFLKFFALMAIVFVVFNPSILLPGSWRAMANFTNYRMMGHDSYEFMGHLYPHRFTDWLRGEPWYFYFVLMAVKLPLLTLVSAALGSVLCFKRKAGEGRYFILLWLTFWSTTFLFAGGKFTRYFTFALPAVLIAAALGVQSAGHMAEKVVRRLGGHRMGQSVRTAIVILVIAGSLWSATTAAPNYRLYMNAAFGASRAGKYFPQDEFYDAYMKDAMNKISARAPVGARVASELPTVATYYADRAHRSDLECLELSDPADLAKLTPGDFVVDAHGRTYFSNQAMLLRLRSAGRPVFTVSVGSTTAADVYILDQKSLFALRGEK